MEEVKYRLLGPEFYLQEDVVGLARELLGKLLMTRISGTVTGGMISETEAYRGIVDRASHSFGGRKTKRTSTMYREGGIAYVYLCYGIHSLFNVVTNKMDIPDAVLIRGIFPVEGLTEMGKRIGREVKGVIPVSGPGLVSKALHRRNGACHLDR